MRRSWALLLALVLAPLIGCITGKPEQTSTRHDAHLPLGGSLGDDLIYLEVAVLECPVNDAFINGPLWDLIDETANPERKTILHDNGFRMGVLGPALPERLADLITSERNTANVRDLTLPSGIPASVPTGPHWTHCRYELNRDGEPLPIELDKAQCVLEIVPAAAKDGQIALSFTPLVQHGQMQLEPRAVKDPSGVLRWDLQANPLIERYPWLSWELTVAANDYIVVGTQMNRTGTLGHRSFLHTESLSPVQRLLVLRVVRGPGGETKTEDSGKGPPPLARQAVWTSVRGSGP